MSKKDHFVGVFEGILNRYLDADKNVNYLTLMVEKPKLEFAEELATFDLSQLKTPSEQLAFYINAYNALSIYGVVKKLKKDPGFGKQGNRSWFARIWFFGIQRFTIGGRKWTLYQLENFIRKAFSEPRIHFALNCASQSCPILKDGRYSAANLENELSAASQNFIRSPSGVKLDETSKILHLSMIFKWYRKDFEKSSNSVIQFITPYLLEKDQAWLKVHKNEVQIQYMPYNWGLNITPTLQL